MSASQKSTRSRILEAARQLFWLRGYSSTSVNDLLAHAQANSGSFYHFFKNKEQLLLAVVRAHTNIFIPGFVAPAYKIVDHPAMRVIAILRRYRQNLLDSDFTCGCPVGKLALEIPHDQPQLLAAVDEHFRHWRSAIDKCLQDMRDDLPRDTDFSTIAVFALALVQGAIIQCRVARAIAPFDAAIQIFATHLDLLMNQRCEEKEEERIEARKKNAPCVVPRKINPRSIPATPVRAPQPWRARFSLNALPLRERTHP
jgi:TetR/AcrR family transcriptional repressor of nem operon